MSVAACIPKDFRRLFEQEGTRLDADEFIRIRPRGHYSRDYDHVRTCFVGKKLAEERAAYRGRTRERPRRPRFGASYVKNGGCHWVSYIRNR